MFLAVKQIKKLNGNSDKKENKVTYILDKIFGGFHGFEENCKYLTKKKNVYLNKISKKKKWLQKINSGTKKVIHGLFSSTSY